MQINCLIVRCYNPQALYYEIYPLTTKPSAEHRYENRNNIFNDVTIISYGDKSKFYSVFSPDFDVKLGVAFLLLLLLFFFFCSLYSVPYLNGSLTLLLK